jgi:hypothetical protein
LVEVVLRVDEQERGAGGVSEWEVAAQVPIESFGQARADFDGGEQHADEPCVLDVGGRVVAVQAPVPVEELQHDVGGDGERLRLGAP